MKEFYSPLRYPGGKGKLAFAFKQIVEQNNLYDSVYVEPYVGGGAVALTLLFEEYVQKIIINDYDRSVYAVWHSMLYDTEAFCSRIARTPINIENWKKQKDIQNHKTTASLLDLGFSTFFLNRTNRSGIIKAGVIGGLSQQGPYLMSARYNPTELIARVRRIAEYSNRIEIHNQDACKILRVVDRIPLKKIIYLDPPYYVKGSGLYMNAYKDVDHENVARCVRNLKHSNWVMTYDNVPFIRNLYQDMQCIEFDLNYSAGKAIIGKEVIISTQNIKLPTFV